MSHSNPIRIGIIGAGNIGNVHMEVLSGIPEAQLAAVTDVYLPLAESRAKQYNIEKVYANTEQLLADASIDAVIIAVSNEWHAPIAVQALQAGKHVMLEKPMAINLESAKTIVEAERQAGKILMIPHQLRWESLSMQVKDQAEKGALGHIYHAKAGWVRRKGIPGWGTWFTQMEKSGGGPLIDLGVHMLDLSLYLMGNPKPVSVYGATYSEFGPRKRGIGTWGTPNWNGNYDVEDLATALIKLDNGATLSLDVSWAALVETDNQPYVQLLGSEGGASIRGTKGKLLAEMFDREADVDLQIPDKDEGPRARMAKHFLACIREGKQPITSVMTGYTNNLILDAIYRSSETGKEIELNWEV
ncbi:Gfo/Idh/MocA family protein [Paenibacillus hexagrammi]|uniref:Gfo/Idh/MocA family oxidoreductase n=1 Tax=Paenibacillus hexagrammi TaxID=2908839 RepID=A0ABY3SPN2_9BACL|nr:Gfo/Idh/MocA family oxidoreductase [Paenibacillus sp. YPD9-1]UJF35939.1 Gfo/Idh/MocA family oxidoreductase [Paenibacillus sp. YPD9-1]